MKTTFIYTLSDVKGNVRYIGKSNTPRKRLYSHIKECKTDNISHKINWIKSLLNNNETPIIEVLEEVLIEDWESSEVYWIEQFRQWGFNLTNIASGGIVGNNYKRTNSTKQKMRVSKLGTKLPEEQKRKISESLKETYKDNPREYEKIHYIDRDLLYQKYIIENLSLNKCALFFGTAKSTIFKNLVDNNISKEKSSWVGQLASHSKKVVLQYDLTGNFIKEWLGVKSITNELFINSSNIANCCRGKAKTAGGFIWKYKK